MHTAGLLLAAGAGRRLGVPKALVRDGDGVLLVDRAVRALTGAGCVDVTVVVGAAADEVRAALARDGGPAHADGRVRVVEAAGWDEGMGASLRTGLEALSAGGSAAAVVTLVDLPDVGEAVCRRLLAAAPAAGPVAAVLVRAAYRGVPGHPVLLGRDHWAGVRAAAVGDRGARDYLAAHPPALVECGDLATGADADTPEAARAAALHVPGARGQVDPEVDGG